MANTPITDDVRAKVLELARSGTGRNEIARQLGISAGSVTKITATAGAKFDRAEVADATEARRRDLADRRTRLEQRLLIEAESLIDELRKPAEYRQAVGGQAPQVMQWEMPQPIAADKLKLVQAASTALDRSLKLSDVNAGQSVEQGKSMLGDLLAGLKQAHRERQAAVTVAGQDTEARESE